MQRLAHSYADARIDVDRDDRFWLRAFLGKKSDDQIATDAIWEFFVAHPR